MSVSARVLRRAVAAVLLLPIVGFATSFAHAFMRCRMTGAVVESCGCPDAVEPSAPRLVDQSCCERREIEPAQAGREITEGPFVAAPAFTGERVSFATDLAVTRPFARSSCVAHADGPPLVLLKHSFLI